MSANPSADLPAGTGRERDRAKGVAERERLCCTVVEPLPQLPPVTRRVAVIANPAKLDDREKFRAAVCSAAAERGWGEPMWLETTPADPGAGQARTAVQAGVDLVLASGGDGTVTACAASLVGSGVPLAVIPAGTGNLLARNLGLPRDLADALTVAFTGTDRPLDVGIANGAPFLAMAGLGLDAKMLESTSELAKKRFGWAAYAFSALRHLRDRPMRVTLQTEDGRPRHHRASGVIVGNVGALQGGLPLLPDARPDDGRLDVVVLSARGWASWPLIAADVLRRAGTTSRVARLTFRELRVDADRPHSWEIDGELMGAARRLVITIHPEKLLLRVPGPARPGACPARPGASRRAAPARRWRARPGSRTGRSTSGCGSG
jgi:YegS/Rv2252/BmrU family lipid kinase